MKPRSTGLQVAAVTLLTLLALAGGVLLAAFFGDFTMRAGSMDGMAHGRSAMDGMGGHDIRRVDTSRVPEAAWDARGNQPLMPAVNGGVKEFRLTAGIVRWSVLPNVQVGAYAYNGQVPGPEIRLTRGDRARFIVTNDLPEPTTVRWHGSSSRMSRTGPRT
jgi:FtsP/CotA-like multicopper oxidase with cupredoxin domain